MTPHNGNLLEPLTAIIGVASGVLLGVMVCLKSKSFVRNLTLYIIISQQKAAIVALKYRYLMIELFFLIRIKLCNLCHFLDVKLIFARYFFTKIRLYLRYRFHLFAYEFDVPAHFRRVCAVKNKLVNSVQMLCKFHKSESKTPNEKS